MNAWQKKVSRDFVESFMGFRLFEIIKYESILFISYWDIEMMHLNVDINRAAISAQVKTTWVPK